MTSEMIIHLVGDADFRAALVHLLAKLGYDVREYASGSAFAEVAPSLRGGCALIDMRMPDLDGVTLQRQLVERRVEIPVIITGDGDVPVAVEAMKAGAVDFLQKPFPPTELRASVEAALKRRHDMSAAAGGADFKSRLGTLTVREREVLEGVVAGQTTKIIASRLGISPRTVDVHRARIMGKLQVHGLSNLVRLSLAAGVMRAS